MGIDWYAVNADLGLLEDEDDPEAIVHEMGHAYDCRGEAGLDYIGMQSVLGELIDETYPEVAARDASEFRVSVATHLVLLALGLRDERWAIFSRLLKNLERGDVNAAEVKRQFDAEVESPSPQVRGIVEGLLRCLASPCWQEEAEESEAGPAAET